MPQERQSPQPQAETSHIFLMFFLLLFMMVLFNPNLRKWMGESMGAVLEPYLGFDRQYSVVTIFLAGIIMIVVSTSIRHFFIDWMEMARIQKMMFAFNKELRETTISGNQKRKEELMKINPQIMKMQAQLTSNQMKPMMFTMLIAIPIFMWLYSFVRDLSYPYITIPLETQWDLTNRGFILPNFIWIYSFLSLPVGQTYMRFLKVLELKGKLSMEEENLEENTAAAISGVRKSLKKLQNEGMPVDDLEKELKEGISLQQKNEHKRALKIAETVKKKVKTKMNQMETAKEHLRSLEDMRKVAETHETAENDYQEAKESFRKGDYASAIYYSKQAKKILIEAVAQKEYREGEIARIREVLEEESVDPTRVEACLQRARTSISREEFDEHIEQAERELDNSIKGKDIVLELRNEVIKKIEDALLYDVFQDDLEHIDSLIKERKFGVAKKALEELNLRALRKIKGVENSVLPPTSVAAFFYL